MAYNKYRDFEINEEKTAAFLENAVTKINTGEDIDTLSTLIKLFKKNVPLSRRKYVTAYLLKEALKHYHYFAHNNKSSKNANQNRNPKHGFCCLTLLIQPSSKILWSTTFPRKSVWKTPLRAELLTFTMTVSTEAPIIFVKKSKSVMEESKSMI